MPDFARTGTKTVGFARSPFNAFKQEQKVSKFGQVLKKVFLSLTLVLASLLLSIAIVSFVFLRIANWQRKGNIGIAFLSSPAGEVLKKTTILWVNPENNEIVLMDFPGELTVHTPGSVSYSLKALYGLYAINHATPQDFQKALVRNIKINTPFFIAREGKSNPSEHGLRRYTFELLFETSDASNMPLSDRFALLWYVWFSGANLTKLEFPESLISSGGLDSVNYDNFLMKNFLDVGLKKEGYSIAVVNASAQSRLASTVGRIFTAFGMNVLSVSDTPNVAESGAVVVSSGELINSETVKVLGRYVSEKVQVNPSLTNEYRADVVVILGKKEAGIYIP